MTADDTAVLELEARTWRFAGAKEAAVRDQLGLSPTAYYQRLNRLLDDPEALAYAPSVVRRLRGRRGRRPRQLSI